MYEGYWSPIRVVCSYWVGGCECQRARQTMIWVPKRSLEDWWCGMQSRAGDLMGWIAILVNSAEVIGTKIFIEKLHALSDLHISSIDKMVSWAQEILCCSRRHDPRDFDGCVHTQAWGWWTALRHRQEDRTFVSTTRHSFERHSRVYSIVEVSAQAFNT